MPQGGRATSSSAGRGTGRPSTRTERLSEEAQRKGPAILGPSPPLRAGIQSQDDFSFCEELATLLTVQSTSRVERFVYTMSISHGASLHSALTRETSFSVQTKTTRVKRGKWQKLSFGQDDLGVGE